MNTQGTDGGSVTVGLPDFRLEDTRRQLIALRVKHGANTPIGHRCSNIVEMLGNFTAATDDDQRRFLTRCVQSCMADLAKLTNQ